MKPFARLSFILLPFVLTMAACGPGFQYRVPDVAIAKNQLVVLPPAARALELEAGKMVASPAKTQQMETHLGAAIARTAQSGGSRLLTTAELAACGQACADFAAWSAKSALEIVASTRRDEVPPPTTVADWRFDGDLPSLRAYLKADFVLFTVFQDAWGVAQLHSGGLVGALVTSAVTSEEPPLARHQYGVFCIASLQSGRLVWCDWHLDKWSFLNKPTNAQSAVTHLLALIYGWPKPAGY